MNSKLKSIDIILNHELMQFTKGKTEKALQAIAERHLYKTDNEKHSIDIIVTNNNLQETEQWKIRTSLKFRDCTSINIHMLSSKTGKKENDKKQNHTQVSSLISKMTKALNLNKQDEIPNIIIMCCHSKRVENDCIDLLESFCNNAAVTFNFIFDEADANLGVINTFLSKINSNGNNVCTCIDTIEFVTATPFEEFWKMLSQHEIYSLINKNNLKEENYEELFKSYRELEDHCWLSMDNDTMNPLDYIDDCFTQNLIPARRNIIFAPGHVYSEKKDVGSHAEVVDYFIGKGYTVLLHNGKHKCFIEPDGKTISITRFNELYSITGELRDTLRMWNTLNPHKNLAITGNWTIERGVTFNTNGFNFTHMIVSMIHSRKQNRLLQLLGRANGNKQFVERMIIISPKVIETSAKSFVAALKELKMANPERFNPVDFDIKKHGTIPVKVCFHDEQYREYLVGHLIRKKNYAIKVHNVIKEGIHSGHITIEDKNNVRKFNIGTYKLKTIRRYTHDDSNKDNRRFQQFADAFTKGHMCSQQCAANEYCLDIALLDYVKEDFINTKNIGWITFH